MSMSKRTIWWSVFVYGFILFHPLDSNLPQVEVHQHKEPPIKVPSLVDGTPFGINGNEIRKLIFIIREVEKMLHGTPDPATKERRGDYFFASEHHSVASLTNLELNTTDHKISKDLNVLLLDVIEDFIKIAQPFMDQARGAKPVTLQFMEEWAEKHNKKDSTLLNWAKEKEGQEFDILRQDTTSFIKLEQFCIDLVSFLSDLIQSCPRGWQQFLELQKKK